MVFSGLRRQDCFFTNLNAPPEYNLNRGLTVPYPMRHFILAAALSCVV
jgi:hypothetical protein